MLFLNSRGRNTAALGMSMRDRSHTNKMGHSFIIFGSLSIVTGLILIVIGVASEVAKTKFIGIGIISLGIGFFLTTSVCFYGKLDICYNNWAYRSRVSPINHETPRPPPNGAILNSSLIQPPTTLQKRPSLIRIETQAPTTIISDVEIHKVVTIKSIPMDSTTNPSDNVT